VRPPTPEELAPVMMSYGTSITSGFNAGRADLQWNSLTARALGYDLVNLGSSGTAFCEKEMADYIAAQPWDLCTLEISVNMVGGFTVEEFRKRASYMVDTLAKSHPKAPIFCISILPWGAGDLWKGVKSVDNTKAFRAALQEICESSGHKNVHYVHGPDLLSFTGLWHDLLHPSAQGMIEIAQKLTPKIEAVLKPSPSPAK
jgi:lysophospholipase L1-like esterase